jgi:hypothetical protein
MEVVGPSFGSVGRMRDNSPPHCCNCLPCAQTGVRCGVAMQEEDVIRFPVRPNPSNSLH